MNQQCMLSDVERNCVVKGNHLTMHMIGPPDPKYNPLEPLPIVTAPVATLADVLIYYPAAEFADHICSSTFTVDNGGLTCLKVQCKLTKLSPKPETVCKNLMAVLNQCDWLGSTETKCSSKDGKVFLNIIGK